MTSNSTEFIIQKSADRHHSQLDWLSTRYSFSFADYYDKERMNWGALRVFNDDSISAGKGFDFHPHKDMEIVTYVLSGVLEHEDNLGNKGRVGAGGVQYMSAGTGVVHSEKNGSLNEDLHLIQMWVFPRKKGLKPNYGQKEFNEKERANKFLLVASGREKAPIKIEQDASFSVLKLDGKLKHGFEDERTGFLFIASGRAKVNGKELEAGDSVRMKNVKDLELEGKGELVLWDLPSI